MLFDPSFPFGSNDQQPPAAGGQPARITVHPMMPATPTPAGTGASAVADDWTTLPHSSAVDPHPDDWVEPWSAARDALYPDDWVEPWSAARDTLYPDDWIPAAPSRALDPAKPLASDGNPDDLTAVASGPSRTAGAGAYSPSTTPLGLSLRQFSPALPLSSRMLPINDQAATRPWLNPPGAPGGIWDPWYDQAIKGMQGLLNYFRSRGRATPGGGGDDDYCYARWEREDNRCNQWWDEDNKDNWKFDACKSRASHRRDLCIRNGGRPSPNEPNEWNEDDVE